jgi:hypothetical protein
MLTPTILREAARIQGCPPDRLPRLREYFAEIAASDVAPDVWRDVATVVCESIDDVSAGGDALVAFMRAEARITGRN